MRTDKIGNKSEKKKTPIIGVQKNEKSSCTKPFDYYYKRSLTRNEQIGEISTNMTPKEAFEIQKSEAQNILNAEKRKVREFKNQFIVKTGHAAYEKNLEGTAEMQEREYREENEKYD